MWPRLVCALLLTSGCFIKPDAPAASADASHDSPAGSDASGSGSGSAPVARKISEAYYSGGGASSGMSQAGYSVTSSGITDGELVLFIANIDNGSSTVWMLPPGFHQLHQINYGNDGQTFVVGWKIADHEVSPYAESYGAGINSGHAVITVLAVTGADPAGPTSTYTLGTNQTQSPATVPSQGVATTAPSSLVIFAGGVDWDQPDVASTATFTEPAGFSTLEELSDRGGVTFDWTTLMVSSLVVPAVTPATPHMASIASSPQRVGIPWTVELAIAPAP